MGSLYHPTWRDAKGTLRESPTWWAQYGVRGKVIRESTQTSEYQQAKGWLKEREAAAARHEPVRPKANRVTFTEMAEKLERDYEDNGRHLRTLKSRLVHLRAALGDRRLAQLIPDDLERYKDTRLKAEASTTSINRELEVLNRAFTLGRKLGLLTVSLPVRDFRFADVAPRAGFFEATQYQAVSRRLPPDLQLAIALANALGWRMQSEVLTLQKRHVDLKAGTLRLDPGSTKNDDGRVIYLTPELKTLLGAQLERVKALERMDMLVPHVFPHLRGRFRGQRIKDFTRAWRTACKRAGCPGMLRHDFRRTAVRNMVNRGIPERVAMQITGHKTRSVFDRYHIVSPADLKAAAEKMAGAL
jgi:integrase